MRGSRAKPVTAMDRDRPTAGSNTLRRALGVRDAVAMSVAGMGPTLAMNLNPQEPAKHVGRAIPLVFLASMLLLLLVAWCFAHLSRRHPNAGSAYGFVGAVLGPRAGLFAGWVLLGTYLAFALCSMAGFGLFRSDVATRLHVLDHPSSLTFTVFGALAIAAICVTSAKRATDALTVFEGLSILAMVGLSCAILWQVATGHGPAGDPPIVDLFVPPAGTGPSEIALALSFGFLSFAGFEEAATLAEEVRDPDTTIPRVLLGSILGAGALFVLTTTAQVLGFGADAAGLARFTTSKSLLADLATRSFGPHWGDVMDVLAVFSALGCGLASVLAASRILWAIARDLAPASALARVSTGGTPLVASLAIVVLALAGYLGMRLAFDARGSDAFFWGSTLGALGLLVAYLAVVASAAVSSMRDVRDGREGGRPSRVAIPLLAGAAIAYTLAVNLAPTQPGAYAILPWIVLAWCAMPVLLVAVRPDLAARIGAGSGGATGAP
ncbi:MAG: APC family permease [Alphaproteobacteria bacterium]